MNVRVGDIARRALPLVDLTNLNDDCTQEDVGRLCRQAITPHGNVAAVCVWSRFVKYAKEKMERSSVRVATVVNFAHGGEDINVVVEETKKALEDGADEIDLVQPYNALINGNHSIVREMTREIRSLAKQKCLKVILETGKLNNPKLIHEAAVIALEEGADFVKTSTGKVDVNATPEAAEIMLKAIKEINSGGLKISGGIKTTDDLRPYFSLIDSIMGEKWVGQDTVRIGASSLLDNLINELQC